VSGEEEAEKTTEGKIRTEVAESVGENQLV
jgi:hypothetical protein